MNKPPRRPAAPRRCVRACRQGAPDRRALARHAPERSGAAGPAPDLRPRARDPVQLVAADAARCPRAGPVRRQRGAGAGGAVAWRRRGGAGRARPGPGRGPARRWPRACPVAKRPAWSRPTRWPGCRCRPTPASTWPSSIRRSPPACGTSVLPLVAAKLRPDAWLYVEAPHEAAPQLPPPWRLHREGRTREVRYALYRRP